MPGLDDVILSTRDTLFLLPVTNICKQFLIAKQKSDGVNIFGASGPRFRGLKRNTLAASIGFLCGIDLVKVSA